ncbi:Oidioi.mRNA.OKI2018_I69.chr1.g1239.t1.cds [Oikopleura dioica]|uniref:Oidioi.mRNA.OKI2018_I69.chr1.g1239.t1.cds n=1 Tax=Oikopleura dioica TaxID=34765 RepID=A0ABN7SSI8_OIKDI|nr:Oidioi.mRNA.OKI2018_I69.chr1.g1239.t1.cds [Oikopleura dioica]
MESAFRDLIETANYYNDRDDEIADKDKRIRIKTLIDLVIHEEDAFKLSEMMEAEPKTNPAIEEILQVIGSCLENKFNLDEYEIIDEIYEN